MTLAIAQPVAKIMAFVDNEDVFTVEASVNDTNIIKKIRIKNATPDSDGTVVVLSVFGTQPHECPKKDIQLLNSFDLAISNYLMGLSKSSHPLSLMRYMVDNGFSFPAYPDRHTFIV